MSASAIVGERRPNHVRVEVTLAAEAGIGVELGDRDVKAGDAVGVEAPLDVALENSDATVEPGLDRPLEQGGLAGAGSAHQVDDGDVIAVEVRAVRAGYGLVSVERVLSDPDPGPVH